MRNILLTLVALLSATITFAQSNAALTGRVIEATTGRAIDFADVVVTDTENNTVASTTVRDGAFLIEHVREGEFIVTVMLVGYQPYVSAPVRFQPGKSVDLGTLQLSMTETGLEEIVVEGQRSQIVYKLDRQRISGSGALAASGGTAVDVLKLTPSIRVDAEGGVSFRGSSGFLVYVDGKQSALEGTQALEQIPAANIEDIEIITTPSARYKTDGDVGIINVITKRHDDEGVSGSVNVSGSTIGAWNTDALVSYKSGANRVYFGAQATQRRGRSDFDQVKTTIVDDYVTTSTADGIRKSHNDSYIGRVGWEYGKNGHSLLLEGQVGMTKSGRGGDMLYDEHREQGNIILNDNLYNSTDLISNEKRLVQLATDYVWKVNERGDRFSITGRLRYDWYALEYTESNMFDMTGARYEGTRGYEDEHHWDFDGSFNYILNYRDGGKAEVGYQYTSYSEHGDYNIKYWDRGHHDFVWQDNLYAPFFYRRQIHSAYFMFTDKFGPIAVEAGVRADHTIDRMDIVVEGVDRSRYIKRTELFPSAHLSYEAPGKNFITAGYSYRTNRPGIWQLEPYITYEDYYTKMTGNPDIKPEYIHSLELGYRKVIAEENSISLTGYYRHRRGVRERVRVAYEPGVTLDSLINAGNDRSWGVELAAQIRATRWWKMNINASLFDYKFTAIYEGCTSSANTGYTATMMNNFTLGKNSRLQFDANVVGPTVLTQGREDAYCYFDLAYRHQLFKNKISASVVVHDIFRTARYNNYRISPTLNSTTHVRPKYPNIVLSISYAFNAKHKEHTGAVSKGAVFEGKDF